MIFDTDYLWDGLQRRKTWPKGMHVTVNFGKEHISIHDDLFTKPERWNDPNDERELDDWEYMYMEGGELTTSETKPTPKETSYSI